MRSSGLVLNIRGAVLAGLALLVTGGAAGADTSNARVVPDTFTAKTTAMTPKDVSIKIDIREWSSPEARADAVLALTADDAPKGLGALPTAGFVWYEGSSVGYSVKYAHRDGGRVTFVTDRPVGAFGLKPWTADGGGTDTERKYSVIELVLDGQNAGTGTLSIAADVDLDTAGNTVTLTPKQGVSPVLTSAKQEPKPYWAR